MHDITQLWAYIKREEQKNILIRVYGYKIVWPFTSLANSILWTLCYKN